MQNSEFIKKEILDVIKSVLIATVFALAFVLLFALIIRWASVEDGAIMPVNIAIKLISLGLGVMLGVKHPSNGILKGAACGLLFMLFTFLIFASLAAFKDMSFNWIDLFSLPAAGAIYGVITVNIKGRRQ